MRTIWETEFEELFKKNYSPLFYNALDWVEDAEAAKDIVSELFSEVWSQYEHLRKEKIESYLFRSVRNRSINYLKHKSVETQYQQSFLEMKEEFIDEDAATHEENLCLIDLVIRNFTPQTRFIFEQCYFEGKKYQEIAELMNISASTVHKHMSKAFATFRKVFAEKKKKETSEG
ncbi:RNA polymerase sigma-70 factor [Bacteroides ovatus]|uniref:RNA polymerase sigma-70 factor, ECF subfamily n=1 Tax=Bacteroides ovatus TaxID=28116 RepID=A0A1G7ZD47_BACOV|nr:RNA polymerase sigma-70 factor [Bacteroides ovatus]SDH06673.1 RNA polymerase sigma-70 factor, ECF subfamily [Bacteroides ovatus]